MKVKLTGRKRMSKKYKVADWSITAEFERPDGTWFDHTITDFPEHIGIAINEWLQDYKTTEEENIDYEAKWAKDKVEENPL